MVDLWKIQILQFSKTISDFQFNSEHLSDVSFLELQKILKMSSSLTKLKCAGSSKNRFIRRGIFDTIVKNDNIKALIFPQNNLPIDFQSYLKNTKKLEILHIDDCLVSFSLHLDGLSKNSTITSFSICKNKLHDGECKQIFSVLNQKYIKVKMNGNYLSSDHGLHIVGDFIHENESLVDFSFVPIYQRFDKQSLEYLRNV
eukprot:gene8750-698_t